MNTLRKLAVGLSAFILLLTLPALAWSHIAAATVMNRDTVKGWFESSGFYDRITETVLESASQNLEEQSGDSLPVDDPQVQAIAKQAFNSDFLRRSVENVLDGTYAWLEGRADRPEFAVDLSEARQQLADGLGSYAANRGASLPDCSPEQLAALQGSDFDVLTAPCLPPGVDPSIAASEVRQQLLSSEDFLSDTTISSSDLKVTENGREVPLDQAANLQRAQDAFARARNLPYIFAVIVILATAGIIFLSTDRRAGLRRASITYVTAGVLLGITYVGLSALARWASNRTTEAVNDTSAGEALATDFLHTVSSDITGLLGWYTLGCILLGVIGLVVVWRLRQTTHNPEPQPPTAGTPSPTTPGITETREHTAAKPKASTPKPPRKIQL